MQTTQHQCPLVAAGDGILVLTRAMNERAYFASWLAHYVSIGCSCFIVLSAGNPMPATLPLSLTHRIVHIDVRSSATLESRAIKQFGWLVQHQARRGFAWYLHVDVDEWLVLARPFASLHAYVRRIEVGANGPVDVFQWPWAKVRNLHASCGSSTVARLLRTARATADMNVKSLTRIASCLHVNGPHFPLLSKNTSRPTWRVHHPTVGTIDVAKLHHWSAFGWTLCPSGGHLGGPMARPVRIREALAPAGISRTSCTAPLAGAAIECHRRVHPHRDTARRQARCREPPGLTPSSTSSTPSTPSPSSCVVDGPSENTYAAAALVHVTVRSVADVALKRLQRSVLAWDMQQASARGSPRALLALINRSSTRDAGAGSAAGATRASAKLLTAFVGALGKRAADVLTPDTSCRALHFGLAHLVHGESSTASDNETSPSSSSRGRLRVPLCDPEQERRNVREQLRALGVVSRRGEQGFWALARAVSHSARQQRALFA